MIALSFKEILDDLGFDPDNIAGTSTAGIPHATTLADLLKKPVSYIRSSSKDHGLQNQIEGILLAEALALLMFRKNLLRIRTPMRIIWK